jgi:hypothetical protein
VLGQPLRLEIEARLASKPSSVAKVKQYDKFVQFCKQHGTLYSPPSYEAVGDYLAVFVVRQNGSAKSVGNVVSQLRTYYRDVLQQPFLSHHDEHQISQLIGELHLADTAPVNQKDAFRARHLFKAVSLLDRTQVVGLQQAVNVTLPQNIMLRTCETCGPVRAGDVIWAHRGKSATLGLRKPQKTSKTGAVTWITFHESTHPCSGWQLLKQLWKVRDLDNHPAQFLFCGTPRGVLQPMQRVTPTAMRRSIKALASSIGLDPCRYSGHSLRAGGATDMFARGLPYYVIKKMGRWKSDAALLYFRCEHSVARSAASTFNFK